MPIVVELSFIVMMVSKIVGLNPPKRGANEGQGVSLVVLVWEWDLFEPIFGHIHIINKMMRVIDDIAFPYVFSPDLAALRATTLICRILLCMEGATLGNQSAYKHGEDYCSNTWRAMNTKSFYPNKENNCLRSRGTMINSFQAFSLQDWHWWFGDVARLGLDHLVNDTIFDGLFL